MHFATDHAKMLPPPTGKTSFSDVSGNKGGLFINLGISLVYLCLTLLCLAGLRRAERRRQESSKYLSYRVIINTKFEVSVDAIVSCL